MKKQHLLFATFILAGSLTVSGQTPDTADSLSAQRTLTIDEVVVTGTRHQTDIRHLSQTVSVVNRPGTCSVSTGSREGCIDCSILFLFTTETVCDKWRISV